MTGLVCSACLWIKTVLFDSVIEGDREELRWVSWTDYYFCWVVFNLIYECVHMNVDSLREALTSISVPRQRWSSQVSSNCQKRKEMPIKCSFLGLDFLRGVEWRVDLCAPVHDSGMIKDLYCILILLLCCQQPFPVPNTHTRVQTYAAVHNSTVGAENGKPVSCDGKTECIISICMEWRSGAVKASQPRRIFPRTMREGCYMISDYS